VHRVGHYSVYIYGISFMRPCKQSGRWQDGRMCFLLVFLHMYITIHGSNNVKYVGCVTILYHKSRGSSLVIMSEKLNDLDIMVQFQAWERDNCLLQSVSTSTVTHTDYYLKSNATLPSGVTWVSYEPHHARTLVTKLKVCKSVATLLYILCLDNVHGKNKRLPFILYRISERVYCYFVSWYLRYTIKKVRASYGSQHFMNQINLLYTIGHCFLKFHSNTNLPLTLTRAKQSVAFNKGIETPVGHN
jgi:hypothetical protein